MAAPDTSVPGDLTFTVRVRKQYRIVVPEAERAALGLREGDLVSVRLRRVATRQETLPEGPR